MPPRAKKHIRTFADLAELSARCMRSTKRVGDPGEDASMAVMRPVLAEINALGLVTDDSQSGVPMPGRAGDKFTYRQLRHRYAGVAEHSVSFDIC